MRIIAGEWRGRPLVAPAGQATRPTADRVRESLFSMLASRLGSFDGLTVADLYAGSGALGIEALSRGAAHCTFVDSERAAVEALRRNLQALKVGGRAEVVNSKAGSFVAQQPFHLIFADPPYACGSGTAVFETAIAKGWLRPGGWMAIETARGDAVDPGGYALEVERDIGRARISILRSL
ncbi:16S rRNA (guanine(966)-N(2))-methyltransferase RsmD [Sphingomonas sp. HDW15A]|uniref:16S rRNA (guanine(966)-N(2))-methyltransferase RsmD n=1 Tax=Sphingomonas sp. HDW15A TaxID=2714942 RepID=UPI00140BDA53|nr:16S rRNA (guanine(966)-N(2))-methyltransferase RsmD [Sphingomonas sp. HDW15A]QIK96394.1 16S rRNA (guanine(966)-N(2))-methyltransferase RsmD [Sphingomonas sp. HDW15A]